MLNTWFYSLLSVFVVSLIAFIGLVTLPLKETGLKKFLLYLVSFSAGAMLGDVFIHLLPEMVEEFGFGLNSSLYILLGILSSFIIEKVIHTRHAHIPEHRKKYSPASVMSLIGDGVHNFIDGLIIAASYLVSVPVGLATTLAVVLHEIPQEMGNFGVLIHGGFTRRKALFFNFLSALTAVVGVILTLALNYQLENVTKFLIPFTVGNFIYIAGSDLIPELHKEVGLRKAVMQFVMILVGIGIMFSLLLLD